MENLGEGTSVVLVVAFITLLILSITVLVMIWIDRRKKK